MLLKGDEQEERTIITKKILDKKIISFLILSLVLSMSFVTPAVYADGNNKVVAGEIEFLCSDGTNVYSFDENDELTVKCNVTNNDSEKEINIFVAGYTKNGEISRLIDVTAKSKKFGKNETAVLSDTFIVPENIDENYYIKAFVMDNKLAPYSCSRIDRALEQADEYFIDTPSLYRYYAPGVIRPDEGTIEMTICPDRPATEFGNGYDMPFKITSAVNEGNATANIFAICIPQLTETRTEPTIQIVMKNRSGATYLEKPFSSMSYEVGKKINIAVTWKVGGELRLYASNEYRTTLIGTAGLSSGLEEDTLSYFFQVDKEGPFHVSELKISSRQLSQWELSKLNNFNGTSSDVTLVTSGNLENTTVKKSNWHSSSNYHIAVPVYRTEKQVYYEGENVVYPVMGVNHSGVSQEYDVDIDISNTEGETIYSKSASIGVAPDSKYHITEIPVPYIKSPGLYNIHTRITATDGTYSEYDSSVCVIPDFSNISDGALSEYYGHHINYDADISVFKKLNVTSTRMWFSDFIWNNLEPQKGQWQWKRMDDYVDKCENEDIEILGVLGYPSRWASQEPTAEERAKWVRDEYRPNRWKPADYEEWENYVYTVVDRYKGRIKYWEVYNEVNFHPPYTPAAFSGSTEEYAELLRIAYAAAKRADPDCEILISGFSAPSGAVDSEMPLEFVKSKYETGYYDIFNVHGYSGADAVRSWLSAYRKFKPGIKAFMTEEFPYQKITADDRAYDSVKTPLEFLKDGYDRYYHFSLFGQDGVYTKPDTLSPTEAYLSSAVLQANLRKCDSYDGSYSGFNNASLFGINSKFTRTDNTTLSVLGSSKNTFEISVKGNVISCTDIYGRNISTVKEGDVTKIQAKGMVYIVSDDELTVSNVNIISAEKIIYNGGFEEIDGDIAAIGLSKCTPTNWTLRKGNTGSIALSKNVYYEGQYGLWLRAYEGDKVYAFQDIDLEAPGTYEIRARMRKNVDNGDLKPYMFFFDRDNNKTYNTFLTLESKTFELHTATFKLSAPTQTNAAVGIGIFSGAGEIYIDDIEVVRISD